VSVLQTLKKHINKIKNLILMGNIIKTQAEINPYKSQSKSSVQNHMDSTSKTKFLLKPSSLACLHGHPTRLTRLKRATEAMDNSNKTRLSIRGNKAMP
jgi:hypothetical protein